MRLRNKKGQALVEMAIFGAILLFVFGLLLSFGQTLNDQQYVQMEAFRRALQKANTGVDPFGFFGMGAGASVDMTVIQTRRYVDLSDNFRKGSPTTLSASSSVFWAIPKVGTQAQNLAAIRINEDEPPIDNVLLNMGNIFRLPSIDIPIIGEQNISFLIRNIRSRAHTEFADRATKQENQQGITTGRVSGLKDAVTTDISYGFMLGGLNLDPNYAPEIVRTSITQRLYKDLLTGQYKYSQFAPDMQITRGRQWETRF